MATVTKPIALDESFNTTEQTPRNIADVLAQELSRITGRNASQVEYDNAESGLTADNVQDALDEIAESVPTLPSVDIQTAVDEFSTYNGGLLSSLKVSLTPNQDLHGYDEPWVGGAGKNKLSGLEQGSLDTYGGTNPSTTRIRTKEFIKVDSATAYTFSSESSIQIYMLEFDEIGNEKINSPSWVDLPVTFTTQPTTKYFKAMFRYSNNADITPSDAENCQLELGSTATAYEPYSNICPISGHTQVDVDVSDGQTTQEQVTVNLGGTYYSGTLDVVSGVFVPDTASVEYDGSSDEGWTIAPSDVNAYFYCNASDMTSTAWKYIWSESFKTIQVSTDRSIENTIWGIYQQIHIHVSSAIAPSGATSTGLAEFKTWLSNNPQKVVYELSTPQTIQLSPTMVKALAGENHLSAPLEGQEITESKYKQMFTFDDVIAYIQSLS